MLAYIKVKIKSLAEEAKIIRKEEHKAKGKLFYRKSNPDSYPLNLKSELTYHRKYVVRGEARASQLAYAFMRGKEYAQIEQNIPLATLPVRLMTNGKLLANKRFVSYDQFGRINMQIIKRVASIVRKYDQSSKYEGMNELVSGTCEESYRSAIEAWINKSVHEKLLAE